MEHNCSDYPSIWDGNGWKCEECGKTNLCQIGGAVNCCPNAPHLENVKIWHPEKSIILTKKIGKGTTIHAPVWIGENVEIGKNVKIQAFAFLPDGVKLEDDVFIGPGAVFINDLYPPSEKKQWLKTKVEKRASIGANATIVCGVKIGKNSLLGAGSVLTKDLPEGETWVGNPARKIK